MTDSGNMRALLETLKTYDQNVVLPKHKVQEIASFALLAFDVVENCETWLGLGRVPLPRAIETAVSLKTTVEAFRAAFPAASSTDRGGR